MTYPNEGRCNTGKEGGRVDSSLSENWEVRKGDGEKGESSRCWDPECSNSFASCVSTTISIRRKETYTFTAEELSDPASQMSQAIVSS